MFNEIKERIRDKYLDFDFTGEQERAVLIVFGTFLAIGAIFFALSQGTSSGSQVEAIPTVILPEQPKVEEFLIVD